MSHDRPLDGIMVVALEQAVAAPYASCKLAEAGARVIKIERDGGDFARDYDKVVDGMSAYFVWTNRGKESLVLDVKSAEDQALLERLVAKADVFIQNLSVGAAARIGFDPKVLNVRHPTLITCSISGYGETGPYADMKAYDMLVQGESGLASVTGGPEAQARVGVSVCDIAAGLYAYQAILEALIMRGKTGKGALIKVSLFDGLAEWMTVPLLHHDYGGSAPQRVGLKHPSIAPYESFKTKDGTRLLISIQNEREWADFAEKVLKRPDWINGEPYGSNIMRVANGEALTADIQKVFRGHTAVEIIQVLTTNRIAFGKVNEVSGLSGHDALRRIRVDTPTGVALVPAPPAIIDGWEPKVGAIPDIGEHSDRIRKEFSR